MPCSSSLTSRMLTAAAWISASALAVSCQADDPDGGGMPQGDAVTPPPPSCAAADSSAGAVQAPVLRRTLAGSWDENWLASPALVDIDGDGNLDIVAPRHSVLYAYDHLGEPRWQTAWASSASESPEHGSVRMWSSAAVGDLDGDGTVEIAVAAHPDDNGFNVAVYDHLGELLSGWPQAFGEVEVRSITAADVDGDGQQEIIVNKQADGPATNVFELDGSTASGWPQVGECTAPAGDCIDYGGFNQNIGAGDLDGDGQLDVVSTYDAIGFGVWSGDGTNFPTDASFMDAWVTGVEAYHDPELARQGWGSGDRSEFTYSPPVIADIDGDGDHEIVLGGDHESSESTDNQGVSLWVLNHDMTRPTGWERPKDTGAPLQYGELGGNIVPTYPAPSVGDLDAKPGLEVLFPAYDGVMHAYLSTGEPMWTYGFGSASPFVGASEALIVDLNGDGSPEILFTTYVGGSSDSPSGQAHVIVLDAGGNELHRVPLPGRGSMAAPSVADLDGDGALELVVSLKDAVGAGEGGVQIWDLPGASDNCVLWGTGRGNDLRQGYLPAS
ncbi:MAG: VCBS repeat-containing protein [Nannocystaceae bacterium]|nr:VCBS repeat-containing protein [Nannocystaceae bacterium]